MEQLILLIQISLVEPAIASIKNAKITILFGLIMSAFMSSVLSFMMTLVNVGMGSGFIAIWSGNLLLSFSIAAPLALLIIPVISRVVHKIVKGDRIN